MARITHLTPGQLILCGDQWVAVSEHLASNFVDGDRLIALQATGDLLHVVAKDLETVDSAVSKAIEAFGVMSSVSDQAITNFFNFFANNLADTQIFSAITHANEADVAQALARGRSTARLVVNEKMRDDMIAGLQMWANIEMSREAMISKIDHEGWSVEAWTAPLGVVGFVFEGRPNVFADATGVLRTGNTVVFRIGSDALGTARVIQDLALNPALDAAGLPRGAVSLIDSPSHGAGWALFSDSRLALGVARGSGPAVAQLGAVARQAGVPVSLHGTGGAWILVGNSVDHARLRDVIVHSLDRKVCNTLNVLCVPRSLAEELRYVIFQAIEFCGQRAGSRTIVHVSDDDSIFFSNTENNSFVEIKCEPQLDLAHEWEWESCPEISLVLVDDLESGVELFNEFSAQFVASCISKESSDVDYAWKNCNAPFFGDGFTRWVDGQYALNRPELGVANWQGGRLLARAGILSGDGVHTVRLRVRQSNPLTHR